LFDVTIPNAITKNVNSTNALIPGRVCEAASVSKHLKYQDKIVKFNAAHPHRQLNFIPIAIEVQGKFSSEASKLFSKLVSKISKNKSSIPFISSFYLRKISISLQSNVSTQIIAAKKKLLHKLDKQSSKNDNENSLIFFHNSFNAQQMLE